MFSVERFWYGFLLLVRGKGRWICIILRDGGVNSSCRVFLNVVLKVEIIKEKFIDLIVFF